MFAVRYSALNAQLCLACASISFISTHPRQLSLAIPSWIGTLSTSQRVVTLRSWGVNCYSWGWVGHIVRVADGRRLFIS